MKSLIVKPIREKSCVKPNRSSQYQKSRREYMKSLSDEDKEYLKQRRIWDKEDREAKKLENLHIKAQKICNAMELDILLLMKKQDVMYLHHGQQESMMSNIDKTITKLKKDKTLYQEYDQYIWNYQGEGKNYLPICQFGCIFNSREFKTIYNVPLDGSYKFHIYDSGQRGLGSFNYITATKVEIEDKAPFVNPGGFPSTIL